MEVGKKLKGRLVRVPQEVFPEDPVPAEGFWVAKVTCILQKPRGNAMLKIFGEQQEEFHREMSEIVTWVPHK